MAGDDDIVVTIEGEEPLAGGDTTVVVAPEGGTQRTQPDDPVEALKAQLAEKTAEADRNAQRATTAESVAGQSTQRAQALEREVTAARTEVAQSTKATIESGIAAAKSEADAAQEAFEAAFESGDKKALGAAQRRLAEAAADMRMLEQAKAEMPAQPVRRQEQQQQPANQTEAWISQLSGPSQTWVRNHMDFATDARKNAKVVAAHHDAVGEGITPDSKEYFDHLETFLGMKQKPDQQETKPNGNGTAATQRRPSAPAAPVTATGGGVSGGSANEVKLTQGEAQRATDGTIVWNYPDPTGKNRWQKGDPIGIQEMAKRKQALTKEGRYHNVNSDGT